MEAFNMEEKPERWPANAIECQLENIFHQLDAFKNDPTYQNKEILTSLVCDYDLNQRPMMGVYRTTEYEVALINTLFFEASLINLYALKTYLYELVGQKTRMQKIVSWFPKGTVELEIKEFEGLFPQLGLYYASYQKFTVEKSKSYADQLIEIVESEIEYSKEIDDGNILSKNIAAITHAYVSMLNDISYFRCKKRTGIWAFEREEIYNLFNLAAKLNKLNGELPTVRPLKGVLMTSISNYILKSRNDYNEDYICKYVSHEVAKKSIENHEIWMSIIENLNDDREQKVISELFEEGEWNEYLWVDDIDFSATRKYYVSSFCKSIGDSQMVEDYGKCIYGYKDDRMADILAPVSYWNIGEEKVPVFGQVIAFDVLYDIEEAKNELKFLCSIIDLFEMSESDKKNFLEEILQYWILSVKDNKWSHERERRYILFMYEGYDYHEIDTSDSGFLKMKTSLFLMPDFLLGENPIKPYIRMMIDNKREAISMKPYLFCEDCLSRDFDAIISASRNESCELCGSKNIFRIYPGDKNVDETLFCFSNEQDETKR